MHFAYSWLFVHELQTPSVCGVSCYLAGTTSPWTTATRNSTRTSAKTAPATQSEIRPEPQSRPQPALQPEIRPEPRPRSQAALRHEIRRDPQPEPQPSLQPEYPCIDELMDELFGRASPQPCEEELDFECLDSLFDHV